MPDQRKYDRRDSIFYLKVFARDTDELLGHVVDISEKGIMMVSSEPMQPGRQLALRMHLPEPVSDDIQTVEFEAESRWCKPEANPDLYDIGFEILNPPDRFEQVLHDLIRSYTFSAKR